MDTALTLALSLDRERDLEKQGEGKRGSQTLHSEPVSRTVCSLRVDPATPGAFARDDTLGVLISFA